MVNDRDNKYEGQEDSEYHFSDEEVSYEVESDSPKAAAPAKEKGEGMMVRFSRSKRMLISLVVFLVLVFVVYKMVAPTSTVPPTDITAAPVASQQNTAPVNNPPAAAMQQTQPVQPVAGPAVAQNTNPSQLPAASQPVTSPVVQPPAMLPVGQPANVQQPAQAIPGAAPGVQQEIVQVPQQQMPQQQMSQQQMQPQIPQQQIPQQQMPQQQMPQQPQQQLMPQQQMSQQQMQQQMPQQQSMPAVIPVQSALTQQQPAMPLANQAQGGMSPGMANSAEADRLMGQLQSDYAQKLNDFSSQNKALQDEVQTLNARVASMETQMNQLVQALTRQNQPGASAAPPAQPEMSEPSRASAYSVQAIIPGRAWLRLDNGETVTVAEGDMIKDLGRVTKIDPYDGVVEVNTGSKVISLSYGNGG